MISKITPEDFAKLFNDSSNNFPDVVKKSIDNANFKYRIINDNEYEQAILKIIKILNSDKLKASGPHRIKDWEKGWKEHLREFNMCGHKSSSLVAKFAMQGAYKRFNGHLIEPESKTFENDFVTVILSHILSRYCKNVNTFYEFGAGTGVNLITVSKFFPNAKMVGLDWTDSSIKLISSLTKNVNPNISAKKFDLFKPNLSYKLNENSTIFTVGTLEQLGKDFKPFIYYLLKNKPRICFHLETLFEVYDENNLLDYLAMRYLEKRNYLKGFLPFLKDLERKNKIKIIEISRTFGSTFHEGYTYSVWEPINN